MLPEIYRFGVPLAKSYTTTERGAKLYIMEGIASDESVDQQGESIIQQGLDFQPLLHSGIVNWDHQKGPENIIGEPLNGELQAGPVFFVRTNIYVEDKPRAKAAWDTAEAMKKSGGRRQLGWSVEGAVLQRMGRQIVRSEVQHLALTHQPVNANSFATIVKSMTTGTAPPLMLENLDKHVTDVMWGACGDGYQHHAITGYYYAGPRGALEHLVKCKGMPVDAAAALMQRLINAGL